MLKKTTLAHCNASSIRLPFDHERHINHNNFEIYRETLPALDDSKLPLERRQKLERDAQIMINLLPRNIETEKKLAKTRKPAPPAPKKPAIPDYYIDKALYFDYSADEGRFAKTNADMKANTILLLEKPHVSALLEDYSLSHCSNCFKRVNVPICCPKCADVIFCSEECEKVANSSYHHYECGFLPIFWKSGASITCHMALRMITQKSEEYFLNLRSGLDSLTSEVTDKYNFFNNPQGLCFMILYTFQAT